VEITPALRTLVTRKLGRLSRLLNDSIVSAQVVLTRQKHLHLTDMAVHMRGDHVLAGKTGGDTWTESVGLAVDKVEQQAARVKGKWTGRKRRGTPARDIAEPPVAEPADGAVRPRVVRAPRYHVKPMSVDDAALAVEGGSDPFLVFRNASTGAINVLYRRKDGDLGLIEPER
jgi:putative sigma-54 modulation protein